MYFNTYNDQQKLRVKYYNCFIDFGSFSDVAIAQSTAVLEGLRYPLYYVLFNTYYIRNVVMTNK